MDGAAIYDIAEKQYLNPIAMSPSDAYSLCNICRGLKTGYCIYAVRDNSMMIYRGGNISWAEQQEYELMKRSPYRNYLEGDFVKDDQIMFIRVIDINRKIDQLEQQFTKLLAPGRFRMVRRAQPKMEGYSGLYFYHPKAAVENQKRALLKKLNEAEKQKLLPVDVLLKRDYRSDNDAIHLLNRTRNIFEPVIKPWNRGT